MKSNQTDLSKQKIKQLTEELELASLEARIAKETAERALKDKSAFFANMSHEMLTPLNSITGFSDLLAAEDLSERQRQYVRDIQASAVVLSELIGDILDLSKIDAGRLKIKPVHFNFSLLIADICSTTVFNAQSKGLEFIEDIRLTSPFNLYMDEARIRQVLLNLLSNAVKYTQKGYVRLTVYRDDGRLVFNVFDTGEGIKKDDLKLLFSYMEHGGDHNAIKGTGLGLSVSNSLVNMMGGKIWVESEPDVGSTFGFSLPLVQGDDKQIRKENSKFEFISAPAVRALIVDDLQTNLTVAAGFMRLCNISSDLALSGFEAIEFLKEKDFDIIFMDRVMPGMDGVETTKQIRRMGGKYERLPIIALTANAASESKDYLLKSGMNDFLSKPIDKVKLIGILQKWLPSEKLEKTKYTERAKKIENPFLLAVSENISEIDVYLALDRAAGIEDVLEAAVRQIVPLINESVKKLDEFLASNEIEKFNAQAHGLRGALANIGAMKLVETATVLEMGSKSSNLSLLFSVLPDYTETLRGFSERLTKVTIKARSQKKSSLKKITDTLKKVVNALDISDADMAVLLLNGVREIKMSSDMREKIDEAVSLTEDFDLDAARELICKLITNV